jgi:hypothetical protein
MPDGEHHADEPLVDAVRTWLRERVVGLGLCPYAAGPLAAGRVRLAVAPGDLEARLTAVYLEAERLLAADPASCETTLVLLPDAPASFLDFYDETELAERLVEQAAGEELQVVTFHPRFRFADADPADPANGVNRAPVALWQLLREASVARVVEADPDRVDAIPGRNRDLLRHLVAEVGES